MAPDPHEQLDLFGPALDTTRAVKASMFRAARASGMSREQIVDRMNEVAGRHGIRLNQGNAQRLTVETLEKWLAVNDDRRIPYHALPVFCRVVGSAEPIAAMLAPLGGLAVMGEEVTLLEWARAHREQERLQRAAAKAGQQKRDLAKQLGLTGDV